MRPADRIELDSAIGRAIQAAMKIVDIPRYLAAFGVRAEITEPVSSKWVFVRDILRNVPDGTVLRIARDLGVPAPSTVSPGALDLAEVLSDRGMQVCQDDFARALETVDSDPSEAIGHACTTLESICKAILDAVAAPLPKAESLKTLFKAVADQLQLSPDSHADADLKQLLGGLSNAAAGIATIRTKYSAFHGKSPQQRRLVGRHARLAINAASAVGLFLVETYAERFSGTEKDDLFEIEEHIASLEEQQNAPFTEESRAQIRKMFRPPPRR